jgi:Protein of unknown function (DUF2950)
MNASLQTRTQSPASLALNEARPFLPRALFLAMALLMPLATSAADATKTFATAEEAVQALATGVKAKDRDALRAIFGPAVEDIANPDRVQATNEFTAFAAALDEKHTLVQESPTKCVLEVGANSWPFPIPIVQRNGRWSFDTAAGEEEIANRRIGKNELEVLQVMRAYVDAQREYASRDRDNDGVLEYAQKITSSAGQTDGLFWPTEQNGELSPLGPFVADAQSEGYFGKKVAADTEPRPFHGYFFKILKRQGKHAPGGAYNYVINGNMIGGFALVAWPAEHGHSGIMTFIVNQQGRVYQKDLGPATSKVARKMNAYDPDPSWQVSPD